MKLITFSSLLLLSSSCIAAHSIEVQSPLNAASPAHPPTISSSSSTTEALLSLHKSLIEYESISGHEHDVGQFLVKYLQSKNFTVETQDVDALPLDGRKQKQRQNVLAYVGKTRQTRTLVSSHIDTVPPYWKYERIGDEIWGRGSVDAKGSVAAQITAVEDMLAAKTLHEGDVALLFVVGEEVSGGGMRTANKLGLEWETVIFGEPTELKLASGHKGILSLTVKAKGKAGHSGYPELGKNANAMLIPALYSLLQMQLPSSEKYGNTTLNVGRMEGGVAGNVIAEDASAMIAIRIADGGPEDIKKIISETLEKTEEEFEVTFGTGYGPVYIDSDVPGFDTIVVNYGTDIPNLKGDHKRYLYGPGSILLAHSDHEHLNVKDLETAVKGYKTLIEYSLK